MRPLSAGRQNRRDFLDCNCQLCSPYFVFDGSN
jgi:hypothetical protein